MRGEGGASVGRRRRCRRLLSSAPHLCMNKQSWPPSTKNEPGMKKHREE